jgi:uncharacterized protein (DUF1330 family)
MVYALNLFNFVPEKENIYREYSLKAGKIVYELGGKVVSSGFKPVQYIGTDVQREQFIVVEFPSPEVFKQFYAKAKSQDIHRLREESTRDYIWILFQPWDLREWAKNS